MKKFEVVVIRFLDIVSKQFLKADVTSLPALEFFLFEAIPTKMPGCSSQAFVDNFEMHILGLKSAEFMKIRDSADL